MHQACGTGLRTADAHPATINALAQRGLIHRRTSRKGKTSWRATDTGRGLIASAGLVATYLHRRSQYAYTHLEIFALLREPEAIL